MFDLSDALLLSSAALAWAGILIQRRIAVRIVERAERERDDERALVRILLGFGSDDMKLEQLRERDKTCFAFDRRFRQMGVRILGESLQEFVKPAPNFMHVRVGHVKLFVMKDGGRDPMQLILDLKAENKKLREGKLADVMLNVAQDLWDSGKDSTKVPKKKEESVDERGPEGP